MSSMSLPRAGSTSGLTQAPAAVPTNLPPASVPTHLRTVDKPVPPGSELFVIATHKVRDRSGPPPYPWVPYGPEHGWRPGSRRTLCGEWTAGWTVFWERRFSAQSAQACRACVEASLPAASRSRLAPRQRSAPDARSA